MTTIREHLEAIRDWTIFPKDETLHDHAVAALAILDGMTDAALEGAEANLRTAGLIDDVDATQRSLPC